MKIYTKTGDQGETSYIGGRTPKDSSLISTLGSLDELNAHLGLIALESKQDFLFLQNLLFEFGGIVANPKLVNIDLGKYNKLIKKSVTGLERDIDSMDADLPSLKNFILPGGSEQAAKLHLARAVCRRTEREIVGLINEREEQEDGYHQLLMLIQVFLNRLSDYLFVLARYVNAQYGVPDLPWQKVI